MGNRAFFCLKNYDGWSIDKFAPMKRMYNFLGSWQLFPEKGTYESGERPRSGILTFATLPGNLLAITNNWTTISNEGFATRYEVALNEELPFPDTDF